MVLKKSELIVVAKELNDVLGLDPEINVKGKVKKLQQEIIEAGQLIDPVEDEFTDETWAILEELGAASRPGEVNEEEEEEGTPDAVEEEETEEVEQEPSEPVVQKSARTAATERRAFMEELISKGEFTKKEIIDKTLVKFSSISQSSVATELSDGKNPKYNKFAQLLVIDEDGIVSFKEGE